MPIFTAFGNKARPGRSKMRLLPAVEVIKRTAGLRRMLGEGATEAKRRRPFGGSGPKDAPGSNLTHVTGYCTC